MKSVINIRHSFSNEDMFISYSEFILLLILNSAALILKSTCKFLPLHIAILPLANHSPSIR